MADKVVYLFNSASRQAYKSNLHRILALPIGGKVQFRYSLEYSVPPDLGQRLEGYRALIVFVDRYSEGKYTYYPIRRGKVLEGKKVQNRLIIECQLLQFCDTDDAQEFTSRLKGYAQGAPELLAGDPNNKNDGYYVQLGEEFDGGLITDSNRWHSIVRKIFQTEAFGDDPTAFLKLSLKKETEDLVLRGHDGGAFLKSDKNYLLEIFYYDPDEGRIDKSVALFFKDPLEKYGPDRYKLGAITDLFVVEFKASKTLSSLRTSIDVAAESQGAEKYRLTLPIRVSSWSLLGGIVFYALIGFLTFIVPKIWSLSNSNWSFMFEIIRYLVIIRLFIKFGTLSGLPFKL